jgi:hypothetical protein
MPRPKKPDAKVTVPLRLRPVLLQQVDDWSAEHGMTRQEALERAIEALVSPTKPAKLTPPQRPPSPARARGEVQEATSAPSKKFVSRLKGEWSPR